VKINKITHLFFFRIVFFVIVCTVSLSMHAADTPDSLSSTRHLKTAKQIYMTACSACHGADGRGTSPSLLGFRQELPDFTDCEFASREPDGDWVIVAYYGGPIRGFSEFMPAFAKILTKDQLLKAVQYIRNFCTEKSWPRGELNLPKPQVTEKAFPEDEAIFFTSFDKDFKRITNKFVYETRFGSRNQIELSIPYGWNKLTVMEDSRETSDWSANLGDLAIGYKRVLFHNHRSGSIFSIVGEVILPTGDESDGLGKGTVVLEPFLVFSQILSHDFFLHAQAALEFPLNKDKAENEGLLRIAFGRSFSFKPYSRTWSPMIELLASRELGSDGIYLFDIVPQIQVTLNQRQHIMFNIGVRIPVNQTEGRDIQILAYILWDWFDGGFFEGWQP
jgi:mono/diheme cytochrome c family protein